MGIELLKKDLWSGSFSRKNGLKTEDFLRPFAIYYQDHWT